jgi:SAM-dependent methyltransferase
MLTPLPERAPCQGVRQVFSFNWPLYALATSTVVCTAFAICRVPVGSSGRVALFAAIGFVTFWIVGSLFVSWFVYDRSPLMAGRWVPDALGMRPRTWINLHAGLDEWTSSLRALLPQSRGRTLDIFDSFAMGEPSIARARRGARQRSEQADFRHLPVASGTIDAVFLFFCAHELRRHAARCEIFREAARVLVSGGRVLIAEHLRDWRNLLAFGPGFLHFHSRGSWLRCFAHARLQLIEEFSITPFVRVFVLEKQL